MDLQHPRLAPATPVVWREPGVLQVGAVPGRALVLEGVPTAMAPLLEQLDGTRTVTSALDQVSGERPPPATIRRALAALASIGLLTDGPLPAHDHPRLAAARLRLVGAGVLGSRIAEQLVRAGVGTLHLHDNDPIDLVHRPGPAAGSCQAEALRAQLERDLDDRSPRPVLTVLNHWAKPDHPDATDFTVVALDGPECDRAVSDGLLRNDEPHLFVRTLGAGATVGPLVVPGQTACLRCLDLTRCDTDPQWPTVLGHLVRSRVRVRSPVAHWAATTAVTQTLAWLVAGAAELLGSTAELAPDTFATQLRRWPAHPRCGCGWPRTAEWSHGS